MDISGSRVSQQDAVNDSAQLGSCVPCNFVSILYVDISFITV